MRLNHLILMVCVALCMAFTSCSSSKSATATAKSKSPSTSSTGYQKTWAALQKKANAASTTATESDETVIETVTGKASYYADRYHGRTTANGEKYDKTAYTCAHRTYKFGTILRVTNTSNNKSVKVRVNDRGPYAEGRIVDLSRAAAEAIDMVASGVISVKVEVLSVP